MTPAQLAVIDAELANDPRGYGYAAPLAAGNVSAIAELLNLTRDGTAGRIGTNPTAPGPTGVAGNVNGKISVRRNDVTRQEIVAVIDSRDITAQTNTVVGEFFAEILQANPVPLSDDAGNDTLTMSNLKRMLGTTQGSQGRLTALAKKNGSRIEELLGVGTAVTHSDVSEALLLP